MLISFVKLYLSFGIRRISRSYLASSAWTFLPASSAGMIPFRWILHFALLDTYSLSYSSQILRISSELEKFKISLFVVSVSSYMALIPSSPSKYWMRGWAVSPRRRFSDGTAFLSEFAFCSKVDATISGSVGEKYLMLFFVTVESSPFSFNFFMMSYVVTRLIFALAAICETTVWPSSIIER